MLKNEDFLSQASIHNIKFNLTPYTLVLMVDSLPLHAQLQFPHIKRAHCEDQLSGHKKGKSNCRVLKQLLQFQEDGSNNLCVQMRIESFRSPR